MESNPKGAATNFSIYTFWGLLEPRGCPAAGCACALFAPLSVTLQENLHVCTRLYMNPITGLSYRAVWHDAICNFVMSPNAASWHNYKVNVKIQVIAYFNYNIIPFPFIKVHIYEAVLNKTQVVKATTWGLRLTHETRCTLYESRPKHTISSDMVPRIDSALLQATTACSFGAK